MREVQSPVLDRIPGRGSKGRMSMGHYHKTVRGVGRDRKDAEGAAISDFFYEHGHRHSLREVESAVFIKKVPPKKQVEENRGGMRYILTVDDPEAPPDE